MQATPELIEMITKQVIQSLQTEKSCGGRFLPRLLILGDINPAESLAEKFSLETVAELDSPIAVTDYEALVLTQMDASLLADVALGQYHCKGAKAVSDALFLGKPVYALEEGISFLKFKHTANARYYQMYVEYIKKLESFGVMILPTEQLYAVFRKTETKKETVCAREDAVKPEQETSVIQTAGLFSADMAREYAKKGEKTLRVAKGTLMTPLAKDVLREKKIELIFEG